MIVKIIGNRGGGSAKASVDYLLGKDRNRKKARILEGDPDITQKLADSLDFKNKYTVGVLSFEEENLPEKQKYEIIEKFEKATFAGLDKNQYSISWIEHTDKGRLELNFIVANVELKTQKRLQPYYDKVDRKHINSFQNVINHEYKLSDPHDPSKKQLSNSLSVKNLPKKTAEIKAKIDEYIIELIANDVIKNRDDVINILESSGFDISRTTDNSISLKNPDPDGRNIRLKGAIYENREFSGKLAEEQGHAYAEYQTRREDNFRQSLHDLERRTEEKREYNKKKYSQAILDPSISSSSISRSRLHIGHSSNADSYEIQRTGRAETSTSERRGIHQYENEYQQAEVMGENRVSNDRRGTVYSGQRETGPLYIEERQHSDKSEVNGLTFDYSPIKQTLTEQPKTELKAKQDNKKQSSKVSEVYAYAKQFYSKCREFIERIRQRKSQITRIQQDIESRVNESKQRESIIDKYHRDIESTNQRIGEQSRKIDATERAFNDRKSEFDSTIKDIQSTIRDVEKQNKTIKHTKSDDIGLSKNNDSFNLSL